MDVVLYAGSCIDRIKRNHYLKNFFLVLVIEVINKPVGCRVNGQVAAVAQCAQASARHLDGTTLWVDENERIEVRLLVQQAPDVGFELERFVLQAMVLGIVVPEDLASG